MGYHPGAEDDAVYLAAVKASLHPELFPRDADFVRLQTQATFFVPAMAEFVRLTHMPLEWAECFGQFISLFGILYGALSVARRLFPIPRAYWAGVALLAVLFTLPVAGTALYIADQHLHPRTVATALILLALGAVLRGRRLPAIGFLVAGFLMHPVMAVFGASLCAFVGIAQTGWFDGAFLRRGAAVESTAGAAPLGWIFQPPSASWRQALSTRSYYFLDRWRWYEWLGALAPLALFCMMWRVAGGRGERRVSRFALGALLYGVFQQSAAMLILAQPGLVRLTPLQPMRYLHLVYVLMVLIAGCLLGMYVLKRAAWRWCALLAVVAAGMFIPQRLLFAGTEHVEWPGRASRNEWLQAYAWIRSNTPRDAYFAVDPRYLASAGNDAHGLRALAERSQTSDGIKDPAVVTQVPQLGPEWVREQQALAGWEHFETADFLRLRAEFGVGWALVRYPATAELDCVWHNQLLAVCRIPVDR